MVELFVTLSISVAANVASYYICKWLDGKKRNERQQQPEQSSSL